MTLLSDITVNGRGIPAAAMALEAQNHPAPRGKPGAAWQAAARALALREILVQEAHALALVTDPQEVAPGQWESDDEALIRQLLEASVTPEPVDEAALRAIYDAAPGRFRAPPLWEAAQILIPAPPGDATPRRRARALAQQLIAELAAHPARFAALAAEHSACDSRRAGGSLSQIGPGDTVPEVEADLRSLDVVAIAPEPVGSRFGFHGIRLDAGAESALLPFAGVAPRLRAKEEKAAWVRAARAFTERVAAEANVTGIRPDWA